MKLDLASSEYLTNPPPELGNDILLSAIFEYKRSDANKPPFVGTYLLYKQRCSFLAFN